jgi:hypothetical protein
MKCEECLYWYAETWYGEEIPYCHYPETENSPNLAPCEEEDYYED